MLVTFSLFNKSHYTCIYAISYIWRNTVECLSNW